MEVMNRALGDMSALDYSYDLMLNKKEPLTKERFREHIYASESEVRMNSMVSIPLFGADVDPSNVCLQSIRDSEVDFLFDLLDYSDDNVIDKDDFRKG